MAYDFTELCLPHYPELVLFVANRTSGDRSIAQDIVQDSMIRAFRAWDRWEPQGDPQFWARAWLFQIVRNTLAMEFKQKQRRSVLVDENLAYATGELHQHEFEPHPYDNPEFALGDDLEEAINRLSPDRAAVIRLMYLEGKNLAETSAALGIAVGTVTSRAQRGRLDLARMLSPVSRARYGYDVPITRSTSRGADEANNAGESPEFPKSDTAGIHGIVAKNDTGLLGVA